MALLTPLLTASDRTRFFLVWLACLAIIGGFLYFEVIVGLAPCKLCYYERIPFYSVAVLGFFTYILKIEQRLPRMPRLSLTKAFLYVSGLAIVINVGITAYHVGVEQKWWEGPSTCSGVGSDAQTVEDLLAAIQAAPVARCDEIPWELFGISLAGYGFLVSLVLSIYIFLPLMMKKRS